MTLASKPLLESGKAYRTRDLAVWSANPARLAKRLVRTGQLVPLIRGLYMRPVPSRFGPAPASDKELMTSFLDGTPFVFTGPERWNSLGLGSTAAFACPLVYNTKRSGLFKLGSRSFLLRRTAFPENPQREWFVVDLLEHTDEAGASRDDLVTALGSALGRGDFNVDILAAMLRRYASKGVRTKLKALLRGAQQ